MARGRDGEQTDFWLAEALGGCGMLKARFRTHRFARHIHDDYGIGLVLAGGHRITICGAQWIAPSNSFVVVNPDEPHDGGAATTDGYSFRVFYLPVATVRAALAPAPGEIAPAPRLVGPVIADPTLDHAFALVHRLCDPRARNEALDIQERMTLALTTLAARHGTAQTPPPLAGREERRVAIARAYLLDRLEPGVKLAELAEAVDASPFQLLRFFRAATGLTPHGWMTQARVARARDLLRQGRPPAEVAAAVGFCDQAHLTRRFLAFTGITPGQYAAAYRRKNIQYREQPRPLGCAQILPK